MSWRRNDGWGGKRLKFCLSPLITPTATPHPPRQARHLLLKEKAIKCSANKDVQIMCFFQLLIHRSAVPLLSQEKAKLCRSFGGWLVKKQGFLLCFNFLLKASHLPSLLQWEKVSRRRSDGWGVFYQTYTFFSTAILFHLLTKSKLKAFPLRGRCHDEGMTDEVEKAWNFAFLHS